MRRSCFPFMCFMFKDFEDDSLLKVFCLMERINSLRTLNIFNTDIRPVLEYC